MAVNRAALIIIKACASACVNARRSDGRAVVSAAGQRASAMRAACRRKWRLSAAKWLKSARPIIVTEEGESGDEPLRGEHLADGMTSASRSSSFRGEATACAADAAGEALLAPIFRRSSLGLLGEDSGSL